MCHCLSFTNSRLPAPGSDLKIASVVKVELPAHSMCMQMCHACQCAMFALTKKALRMCLRWAWRVKLVNILYVC